ncbi:MAG: Hsp20/alpha crystallin family protein [Rickettsiales bacterium]|nr:Hsp20/alpha crystallin family protein [Rickettsiales bacterium]
MNEKKDKTSLKAKIDLKVILIAILLATVFIMLFLQNRKINLLSRYIAMNSIINVERFEHNKNSEERRPRKEFIGKVRREFLDDLNKDMKEMDSMRQRIQNEMNEYYNDKNMEFDDKNSMKQVKSIENIDVNLKTEEKYNKEQKVYTLTVYLLKDFDEKDINISVENGILYLKIFKDEKVNDKTNEFESNFSSIKIVTLPKTKATTKDVKKTFKDGKLIIVVPII